MSKEWVGIAVKVPSRNRNEARSKEVQAGSGYLRQGLGLLATVNVRGRLL